MPQLVKLTMEAEIHLKESQSKSVQLEKRLQNVEDLAHISEFDLSLNEEPFNLFDSIYRSMDLIKFSAFRKNVGMKLIV